MSSEMPESESNIIVDDFFEGWLSMPSMGNLFKGDIWATSEHHSDNLKIQKRQEAAALNPTLLVLDTNRDGQSRLCEIPPKTKVDVNNFQDLLKHLKPPLPKVQLYASDGHIKSHA
jgi:hypothetical protein